MDLSIITVTWNSAEHITDQIRSVREACKTIRYEQFIVDNNSSDTTVEVVKKNFPDLELTVNNKNEGFAAPNNAAAAQTKGEFLLFLNPDMRLAPGSLDTLVAWMRARPDVGIASCKLVDEKGNFDERAKPRRFPTLKDQLAIIFKLPHLFPSVLNMYLYKDFDPDKEQVVDSVRGSFMLMRRELYAKLGWAFDPRYYIWFEDVDVCREAKRLGFKVIYTPVISCVDLVGTSFKKRNFFWKQWQFIRSMVKYFWKWKTKANDTPPSVPPLKGEGASE